MDGLSCIVGVEKHDRRLGKVTEGSCSAFTVQLSGKDEAASWSPSTLRNYSYLQYIKGLHFLSVTDPRHV